MSVWASDSQKLDLCKLIYALGPTVASKLLPERPSLYLGCHPKVTHPDAKDDWDEIALLGKWDLAPEGPRDIEDLEAYFSSYKKVSLGLEAIYELCYLVKQGKFDPKREIDHTFSRAVTSEFIRLVEPSTQISPGRFTARSARCNEAYEAKADRVLDSAESFKQLRLSLQRSFKQYAEVPLSFKKAPYRLLVAGGLLVWVGREEYAQKCLVMSRIHLDYLVGALTRIGNCIRYFSRSYLGQEVEVAEEIVDYTVEIARKSANPQKVAKAFHKARALFQMEAMASVLDDAVISEGADYAKDGLEEILPYHTYRALLLKAHITKALELAHVYKWMPPPDFDATTAPTVVEAYHNSHRIGGPDWEATSLQRDLYERIKVERKINFATAYKARHNQWPPSLQVRGTYVAPQDVDKWEPNGEEVYSQMGIDIVSQIKDKVVVCSTLERELHGPKRPEDRSYLLWYMANAGKVNTVDALRTFDQIPEENFVRSAYKPEAHKPDSRLFYIASPIRRTLLGELESNLANIARYYPGSLMGKDSADKARICAEIMDMHTPCTGIPLGVDYTTYVVTFDLSKFSPKSSPGVTAEYHDFWAKVYGTPAISTLYEIGCKSKITHNTSGIEYTYQNPGCDLEGFRGRMMTMFHADMLSAAVRLARERGYLVGRSKLAVFIDDGALKVAVVGRGTTARQNAISFLEVMKEIYASAGQDNHPSKTVLSQTGGEILATLYYKGLAVPQGVKAIMKLAPNYENAAATFPEEVDSLYATAQGAVKAGCDWVVTYTMLIESIVDNIQRWQRSAAKTCHPIRTAIRLMTPKSIGGFGAPSFQSLVTNAAVNATVEGLGMMNRACRKYPEHQLEIMPIITAPVVKRNALAILRDPLRVRTTAPVMIENRLTMTVVKWLEENSREYSAFMAAYRAEPLIDHATKLAEALLAGGVVSVPVLRRAWSATPLHFVESVVGKFKRSATIISLIGYRELTKLRKKNMADLASILEACS